MCYAREKIGYCFFFFFIMAVTVNPDLPWQILNFLSFVARKAGNTRWRETSIVFIPMPHLSLEIPVVRITPPKYVLVIRVVLLETVAFRDLRLCDKAVTRLRMNVRIIFRYRNKRNEKRKRRPSCQSSRCIRVINFDLPWLDVKPL